MSPLIFEKPEKFLEDARDRRGGKKKLSGGNL
jgi:hypothetical protein